MTVIDIEIAVILALTLLMGAAAAYYNPSQSGIVTAKRTNDSLTSPIQREDPVSVMYPTSLLKIFEKNLGPIFQEGTCYPYLGEARGSIQVGDLVLDVLKRPDVFVSRDTCHP